MKHPRLTTEVYGHLVPDYLRAEIDPEYLKSEVTQAMANLGEVKAQIKEIAAFRPGRPTPTHRMAAAV